MKNLIIFALAFTVFSAAAQNDKAQVGKVLDQWHEAAAKAQFDNYFSMMTDDAVFIGTDAEENWNLSEFKNFAKPWFDKGKAWDFKPVSRNIYFAGDIAYFDELLDTWMKLCRGSGVMKKVNGQWKIAHYVLSMTIPNDDADAVVKIIGEKSDKSLKTIKALPKK